MALVHRFSRNLARAASNQPVNDARAPNALGLRELAILAICVVPLFLNLGQVQLWGSEARWIHTSSEMWQSGDWFAPSLDGEFYGDKPVLFYWAQAFCYALLGGPSELAARVPSALAGAASVFLTAWIGARLFGRRCGALAGCVLATAYSFLFWSRIAMPEIFQAAWILAAVAVYLRWTESPKPPLAIAFFVLLALGGQSKGLQAVMIPAAIAGADALCFRRKQLIASRASMALGALAGYILYILPYVASRLARGDWQYLETMWKENVVRAVDPFDHGDEAFYYYVYILPAMLFPWTLWFPAAIAWAAARARAHAGMRFALLCFGVTFLFFTCSGSRRSYYILPAFPFAALLVAAFWNAFSERNNSSEAPAGRSRAWRVAAAAPYWCLVVLASVVGVWLLVDDAFPAWSDLMGTLGLGWGAGVFFAGAALVSVALYRSRNAGRRAWAAPILGLGLAFFLSTEGERIRGDVLTERNFVAEIQKHFPARDFYYFGFDNETLEYYAESESEFKTVREIASALEHAARHAPISDAQSDAGLLLICTPRSIATLESQRDLRVTRLLTAATKSFGVWSPARDKYYLVRCTLF